VLLINTFFSLIILYILPANAQKKRYVLFPGQNPSAASPVSPKACRRPDLLPAARTCDDASPVAKSLQAAAPIFAWSSPAHVTHRASSARMRSSASSAAPAAPVLDRRRQQRPSSIHSTRPRMAPCSSI
jgi:hypothetical protein